MGQTDRQTFNGHQSIVPHDMGVGHKKRLRLTAVSLMASYLIILLSDGNASKSLCDSFSLRMLILTQSDQDRHGNMEAAGSGINHAPQTKGIGAQQPIFILSLIHCQTF